MTLTFIGAETILYLARLSDSVDVEKGKFWYKKKVYDWDDIGLRIFDD